MSFARFLVHRPMRVAAICMVALFVGLAGTPFQPAAAQGTRPPITADNANQIKLLNVPAITNIVFSAWVPGSTTLMVAGKLGIWQIDATAPDKILRYFPMPNTQSLAVSSDGKLLAVATNEDIAVIDLSSGRETQRLTNHIGQITNLAFRPNSYQLAMVGDLPVEKLVKIQDVETQQVYSATQIDYDSNVYSIYSAGLQWNDAGTILSTASHCGLTLIGNWRI